MRIGVKLIGTGALRVAECSPKSRAADKRKRETQRCAPTGSDDAFHVANQPAPMDRRGL